MGPPKTAGRSSLPPSLAECLAQALAELGLSLPARTRADLLAYVALMDKWNRVYNLTAVRSRREMLIRHVLDSLTVAPHIAGPRVLDVGSGAGLPGIPLALALPDTHFTLLDSVAKKTRFIVQAVGELGLSNVGVETRRLESYQPADLFDTVISRAFSDTVQFIGLAGRLCRPGGQLLAMKGRDPAGELAGLPAGFELAGLTRLSVPGLDEERHLVCARRAV